jgi:hyperosmotically inducible protein
MNFRRNLVVAGVVAGLMMPLWGGAAKAQGLDMALVQQVQKKLVGMPDYDVFDWVTFDMHGRTVVLHGFASRPLLKDEAKNVLKGVQGLEAVQNDIEVLPLSPNDDQIRASVYNRIYTEPSLSKYNAGAGPLYRGPSVARMAGGITNDPPLGFHAIHIIVKNGQVTLYGTVLNKGDLELAYMRANAAPGAFRVTNDLVVQGAGGEK